LFSSFLQEIKEVVSSADLPIEEQRKNILIFRTENAVSSIKKWKSHLVRAYVQDKGKADALAWVKEENGRAYILADWAMKKEPQLYRETMTEFFGKRGANWHITCVTALVDGQLKTHTYVHVFDRSIP
jgi:competence protein ComGF